jgi:hypothetical protein
MGGPPCCVVASSGMLAGGASPIYARAWANLSYSLYSARGKNQVDIYSVPEDESALLGMANHKLALSGSVELLPKLFVSPSLVFLSGRYGFLDTDAEGIPQIGLSAPVLLANLFVHYRGPELHGLSVGLGLYNLSGTEFTYIQTYDGGQAPMHAQPRELAIRLGYDFN